MQVIRTRPIDYIRILSILGFHPRDETAMLGYKTIENGPTSFA